MLGAIGANDFLRQADEYGHTDGDHASSRTDPDNTERLTCIYGSAGCAFQSLPSLKLGNRCSGRGAYPEDRQSRSLIQGAIVLYVPHR